MDNPIVTAVNIATKQNEAEEIKKNRAWHHLYGRVKIIVGLQMVLTSAFPAIGAVAELFWPGLKAGLAFYGIMISIFELAVLDRWQQHVRNMAAKIQEAFDCNVLDLPWDKMAVGSGPEEEDIHAASLEYRCGDPDSELDNWYPVVAGDVPIRLGRIICQRANLRWDSDLRRQYRSWIGGGLLILGVLISLIGLKDGFSLEQLTIGVLAPISPMLLWGIREIQKQGDAAETSDRLRERSIALWTEALDNTVPDRDIKVRSRQLQSGIYGRRVSAPMIFDWIYEKLRRRGEENMKAAANGLVKEAKARGF